MNLVAGASLWNATRASFVRECVSHRLNRFLHAHLALSLGAGCLAFLSPPEAVASGAAWWVLHAVLYAVSLSSILLGLSSAHAEADEFPLLLTLPAGTGALLAGKMAGLALLVVASSALLALPAWIGGGGSPGLAAVAAGAAGVTLLCAVLGLALGFWVRDAVRGLITAVGAWLAMLFGTDLLLLAVAGAPWVQDHPSLWVAPLMLDPLDAFRVTILFAHERVAFAGMAEGTLAGWWIGHAWAWLAALVGAWMAAGATLAWLGARRRIDD